MANADEQLEQRIRERAYRIWLDEGQPEGRSEDHWQLAEFAIAEEDGLPSSLIHPAGQSENFGAATKQVEEPTLVGLAPVRGGYAAEPEIKPSDEGQNMPPRKGPFARSVPPQRTPLTARGRKSDAGGWLWVMVGVVLVAGALVYGGRKMSATQKSGSRDEARREGPPRRRDVPPRRAERRAYSASRDATC